MLSTAVLLVSVEIVEAVAVLVVEEHEKVEEARLSADMMQRV